MNVSCSFFYILCFLRKPHTFRVTSKYVIYLKNYKGVCIPYKFYANFYTFESHDNWYNEVFDYAKHESGFIFLITIILNCISPLLA